jgi:hypothetical protein
MADFSTAPTEQGGNFEIIPDGTLAKGFLIVQPFSADMVETPPKSGGKAKNSYLKGTVTITEGDLEGRKVFVNIMRGPEEKALKMGNAQIRAILEYNGASPQAPQRYVLDDDYGQFWDSNRGGGMPCGIRIRVEKGKDGYADKNTVGAFLSPNPEGDTHKDFARLMKGDTAPSGKGAPPASASAPTAWSAPTKPAAPAAPSQPATTGAAPANAGWGGSTGTQAAQPQRAAPDTRPAWTRG